MTNLQGSEKQIAWAEDIRKEWEEVIKTLASDTLITDYTETRTTKDPLTGQEHTTEVAGTKVDAKMQKALEKAARVFEKEDLAKRTAPHHSIRMELAEKIRKAIVEETEAKFWIDHR